MDNGQQVYRILAAFKCSWVWCSIYLLSLCCDERLRSSRMKKVMYLSSGKPGRGLVRKLGGTMLYSGISWGEKSPGWALRDGQRSLPQQG